MERETEDESVDNKEM